MKQRFQRARAKLNDMDGERAMLASMQPTPEELEWWRVDRRRHRAKVWLRVSVPWMVASAAGSLLRQGRWHHGHAWVVAALAGTATGCFMGFCMWRTLERSVQLRELRGRRIRHELAAPLQVPPSRVADAIPLTSAGAS